MTNQKPCWDATKAYFGQDGTVHGWWTPEDRNAIHYRHFSEQLRWLVSQVDWSGKRVLVTNWLCLTALTRQITRLVGFLRSGRAQGTPIFWYHSLWSLRRLAASAGLRIVKLHGLGLLQATARLPLGRGRFLPLVPRPLADWFFRRVEPAFRETSLLAFMGTISVVCRTSDH